MNYNTLRRSSLTSSFSSASASLQIRFMGTGPRGSRGHGWLHKYRAGEGGRHLQGKYHKRDIEKLTSINDQVFGLNNEKNVSLASQAYLDLAVEGEEDGPHRVIIELASAALPNTCQNFIDLCQAHENDNNTDNEQIADYKGYKQSKVFRILPQVGLCLGDTVLNTGKQGKCSPKISPTGMFPDEPTVISHAEKGIVSMLSTGVDKNDSRFMIMTVDDAPHLDGRHVAFGRVKEGLESLQKIVENTYTKKGVPSVNIEVVGCGVL